MSFPKMVRPLSTAHDSNAPFLTIAFHYANSLFCLHSLSFPPVSSQLPQIDQIPLSFSSLVSLSTIPYKTPTALTANVQTAADIAREAGKAGGKEVTETKDKKDPSLKITIKLDLNVHVTLDAHLDGWIEIGLL